MDNEQTIERKIFAVNGMVELLDEPSNYIMKLRGIFDDQAVILSGNQAGIYEIRAVFTSFVRKTIFVVIVDIVTFNEAVVVSL